MAEIAKDNEAARILVLEDEDEFAKLLAEALEAEGYSTKIVHSVEAAVEEINSHSYNAVFSDMRIASNTGGGLEALRAATGVGVPCIIMTGFANLSIVKEALNMGASYLVEKPFQFGEVLGVLKRLLNPTDMLSPRIESFMSKANLTAKEQEITRLLLKGLPNREIAELTNNTEKTIKFHLTSIFKKAEVKSRTELFSTILALR